MKTKFFLIASLLFTMFNANAALEVESTVNAEYSVMPSAYNECDDPDCMFLLQSDFKNNKLYLDKKSDVKIQTEAGVTIFMGEGVKMLDCSNWGAGNYTVIVNGQEALHFSI